MLRFDFGEANGRSTEYADVSR